MGSGSKNTLVVCFAFSGGFVVIWHLYEYFEENCKNTTDVVNLFHYICSSLRFGRLSLCSWVKNALSVKLNVALYIDVLCVRHPRCFLYMLI